MKNAKFKDSGVQWLGEIPQHWEVVPIRAIFQSRNEDNKALKYTQILSLVKDIGIIPYEDKGAMGNKAKDDLSGYKIARKNDFILNKMNAVIGSLGVSNYDGLVSPIYLILYITNPKSLISFYSYLFQSKTLQKSFKQVAYGIMEIRESIDFLDFKNIKIPLPPLDEQRRIAEFLDKKCEKIAEFIDKKQQIISLLKEQKLALINESTCGRIHTHNDKQTQSQINPLPCESDSTKSPLVREVESKVSPLPCGGGLGVGIKTDKSPSHRPLAPYMKEFSRAMRKNPTQAENKLWQELRGKKLGFGFRRQFVIDSKYIADFVCLKKRLIIECDGGQHSKSPCESDSTKSPLPQHEGRLGVGKDTLNHPDIQRDFYLESQNFRILRFWNNEILGNLEGVLSVIKEALESNVDFANAKYTCESTHPLAPSAREGEQEKYPRAFTFKHSGIEWLGEIPQHWEVRKLKFVVAQRNDKAGENDFKIGLENIESQTGKFIQTDENPFDDCGIKFKAGDILFGKLRPYLAKVYLAGQSGSCVSEFLVLSVIDIDCFFLKFLMLSHKFIQIVNSATYGTKMPRASWEFIGNLKIPLPPLDEQRRIAEFLDKRCEKIDKAIALIEQEIQAIKEYKTSLIDKAVRGEINV